MRTHPFLSSLLVVTVACGLIVGCSGKAKQEAAKKAQLGEQIATIKADWGKLQQSRSDLAAARTRRDELKAIPERKLTDEQKQELDSVSTKAAQLESTISSQYDTVQGELADFLNLALNEYPQAPETAEALDVYTKEAMGTASDYVTNSGNYKKAIEMLETAQGYYQSAGLTPPEQLQKTIDGYEDMRYITKERFEAIKKGMTPDEVAEVAGVPYYLNKKEEKGIKFWLYPKREGGAAAVYFNKKDKVYNANFEAVKSQVVGQ